VAMLGVERTVAATWVELDSGDHPPDALAAAPSDVGPVPIGRISHETKSDQDEGAPTSATEAPLPGAAHLFSQINRLSQRWAGEPPSSAAKSTPAADAVGDSDLSSPLALAEAFRHLDADVACEERPLSSLEESDFPCIALLEDGSALSLVERRETEHGLFYDAEAEAGVRAISAEAVEARYGGAVFRVRPKSAISDRSASGAGGAHPDRALFERLESPATLFVDVIRAIWIEKRQLVIQLLLAASLSYVFLMSLPLFTMAVYDRIIPHKAMETLWALSLGIILALVLDLAIRFVRLKLVDACGAAAYLALQARYFSRLSQIRMADAPRQAGPVSQFVRDIDQICHLTPMLMVAVLIDLPFFFVLMAVLYLIGGAVVLAPIAGLCILAAFHLIAHRHAAKAVVKSSEISQKQSNQIIETVAALEAVKVTGAHGMLLRRWERLADESGFESHQMRLWSAFSSQSSMVIVQGVIVMVLIIGVHEVGTGAITVGALAASSLLVGRLIGPISAAIALVERASQVSRSVKGLIHVLDAAQEDAGDDARTPSSITGRIDFHQVRFSYPDAEAPAVDEIRFSIEPGERVGIIGRVGSGKSSLLRLILRLYDPDEGSILLDGRDIRHYPPAVLRRDIGFMRQDTTLFEGSLHANLGFGLDKLDEAKFRKAIEISGVGAMAARLPKGFSTSVGPRGEALSGGERQMVALARALMSDPPLLLLDEPTAAMDNGLEAGIIERLAPALEGKTLIVATHRAPILKLVDRLIVVDSGRIVSDGPKDQILKQLNAA
ncbi:MAG: ATP-binding cassette domain-containing protein, partial [Pseudomonadota bacterium]